jgi:hypothetical protein
MKIKATKAQTPEVFVPVKVEIICESQAEVNALYQIGNYNSRVVKALMGEIAGETWTFARGLDREALYHSLLALYSSLDEHVSDAARY